MRISCWKFSSAFQDPHDADGNGTPIYGNFKYEALGYSQRGNMDDGRLTALGRNMQVVEM